jgi:hypothetical protein
MTKENYHKIKFLLIILCILSAAFLNGCAKPLSWPSAPLYNHNKHETKNSAYPRNIQLAMAAIEGRYAHYDVVAYEDTSEKTAMKTFIISYGFTEFFIQDGKLYQKDSFCHAEHKINQKGIRSGISDKAVQAIQPKTQEVSLDFTGERWQIHRPPTPSLLGIEGDPSLPLSKDPKDPMITDPEDDGKPGVTVSIKIAGIIPAKIYITRREIFENNMILHPDGIISGEIRDTSEQFTIGATMKTLRKQTHSQQVDDMGLSFILLVPLETDNFNCADLKESRDRLFPPSPEFIKQRKAE